MNLDLIREQEKGCLTCMAIAIVIEKGETFKCSRCGKSHAVKEPETKTE